ncbi:hypothetical protein AALG83_08665 [Christensenellaceae bacterium 44-20]
MITPRAGFKSSFYTRLLGMCNLSFLHTVLRVNLPASACSHSLAVSRQMLFRAGREGQRAIG